MYSYHVISLCFFFFFKQKTAYEMRISDWSSDVCSSDLDPPAPPPRPIGACRIRSRSRDFRPDSRTMSPWGDRRARRASAVALRHRRSDPPRRCAASTDGRWRSFHIKGSRYPLSAQESRGGQACVVTFSSVCAPDDKKKKKL